MHAGELVSSTQLTQGVSDALYVAVVVGAPRRTHTVMQQPCKRTNMCCVEGPKQHQRPLACAFVRKCWLYCHMGNKQPYITLLRKLATHTSLSPYHHPTEQLPSAQCGQVWQRCCPC